MPCVGMLISVHLHVGASNHRLCSPFLMPSTKVVQTLVLQQFSMPWAGAARHMLLLGLHTQIDYLAAHRALHATSCVGFWFWMSPQRSVARPLLP